MTQALKDSYKNLKGSQHTQIKEKIKTELDIFLLKPNLGYLELLNNELQYTVNISGCLRGFFLLFSIISIILYYNYVK